MFHYFSKPCMKPWHTRELTSEFASKPFNHFTNSLQPSLQAGKHFTAHLIHRQKNPSIFSFKHNPGIFYLEQTESVHSALLCGITSERETGGDRDGQRRGVVRAPVEMQRWSFLTATPLSRSLYPSLKHTHKHARCHPVCLLILASQAD